MTGKEVRGRFFGSVKTLLTAEGFTKRSEQIYTLPITEEVIGWLGLNRKCDKQGRLEVNPVIGLRHQSLERLVAEFCGDPFHPYIPPTLSAHLGYVMPEEKYMPILVESAAEAENAASVMVGWIRSCGRQFMQQNVELYALAKALQTSGYMVPEQVAYRVPVALFMIGDIAAARGSVERQLKAQEGRIDPAAKRYEKFSRRLIEHLS